jgi:hypothetical protein
MARGCWGGKGADLFRSITRFVAWGEDQKLVASHAHLFLGPIHQLLGPIYQLNADASSRLSAPQRQYHSLAAVIARIRHAEFYSRAFPQLWLSPCATHGLPKVSGHGREGLGSMSRSFRLMSADENRILALDDNLAGFYSNQSPPAPTVTNPRHPVCPDTHTKTDTHSHWGQHR